MKLLVTGAGGLLGSTFARLAPEMGHDVVALGHRELDIADGDAVRGALRAYRPDVVLNCAAQAGVDDAEHRPEHAMRVNRDGPAVLAAAALDAGARLVHFSTDYVFDGSERTPYRPDHPRSPLGAYARSKAAGEEAVLAVGGPHLVARVSWLFGGGPRDFVSFVVAQARAGMPLRLVSDQWSRPSWTVDVVPAVLGLVDHGATGIWHVCGGGEASREEEARAVLEAAGLDTPIETVTRDRMWPDVPRPAYTVLDVSATEALLGRAMMPWREAVRRVVGGPGPALT